MRTLIAGGPRAGKTTISRALEQQTGIIVKHTDDLIGQIDRSRYQPVVASWFDHPGPWIIEGVTVVRALRNWLAEHPEGKPADELLWLNRPHVQRTAKQAALAKGIKTVFGQIRPELQRRGVRIVMQPKAGQISTSRASSHVVLAGPSKPGADNVIPAQRLPTEFRIFSAGKVDTTKGEFLFDDKAAKSVMSAWKSYGNDIQIDYEHKSVDPASRAGDGLAAGWCRLEVRSGELWAVQVRWTADVAKQIVQGAWKYISPTFDYDHKTGRISELLNVALTNIPATKKLPPLVAAGRESTGATPYKSAPVVDVKWDASAAVQRLRAWAGVNKDNPPASAWKKYAMGFAWVDPTAPTNFGSYKLPHHDIVGGKFVTVKAGVIAAGNALMGSRGGVNIPEKDIAAVKAHLAAHYHTMGMKAPWEPKNDSAHTSAADEDRTMSKAAKKNARLGTKKTKKTVTEVTEEDSAEAEAADGGPGKDIAVDELDEAAKSDDGSSDDGSSDDGSSDDGEMDEAAKSDDGSSDDGSSDDGSSDDGEMDELDEADELDELEETSAPPPPPPPAKKKGPPPAAKKASRGQLERVFATASRLLGVTDPEELEGAIMGAAMQKKTIEKLSKRVDDLNARARREKVENAVESAIKCGRLTPAQREQFVELGMKSPKTLKGLLSTMPKRMSVDGHTPREGGASAKIGRTSLSHQELEIARRSGGLDLYVKAKEEGKLLPLDAFLADNVH